MPINPSEHIFTRVYTVNKNLLLDFSRTCFEHLHRRKMNGSHGAR